MADRIRKREGHQLLLRFNEGSDLRDRLDQIAKLSARSLTAEILYRLEASLAHDDQERSKLAAERILALDLTGRKNPTAERLSALELRVAQLEARETEEKRP